jgi:hypothetical protein
VDRGVVGGMAFSMTTTLPYFKIENQTMTIGIVEIELVVGWKTHSVWMLDGEPSTSTVARLRRRAHK